MIYTSTNGINPKKLLQINVNTKKTHLENKEILLVLPYFKQVKLFEDIVFDKNESFEFTEEYIKTENFINPIDEIIDNDLEIRLVFPEKYREDFLEHFNANKRD